MDKFIQKQMDIASQLYDLINELGFNQRQLSKKSGVDEPTVSEIMRGLANPTLETLVKLEDALDREVIVTPKFYEKDLEKSGYTIIRSSITDRLELDYEEIYFESRPGDASEPMEIKIDDLGDKFYPIGQNESNRAA